MGRLALFGLLCLAVLFWLLSPLRAAWSDLRRWKDAGALRAPHTYVFSPGGIQIVGADGAIDVGWKFIAAAELAGSIVLLTDERGNSYLVPLRALNVQRIKDLLPIRRRVSTSLQPGVAAAPQKVEGACRTAAGGPRRSTRRLPNSRRSRKKSLPSPSERTRHTRCARRNPGRNRDIDTLRPRTISTGTAATRAPGRALLKHCLEGHAVARR
jgi:hypothetical protein